MALDVCKTILLVEDEAIIALAEKKSLERYGYKVITAKSGENALEIIKNIPDVDLILMDVDLGDGIDGPETATLILNEWDIPVVFLSSHTEPSIVEKTEKITSYGYVVKNSGITVLDASIKMAFKLFEAKEKVYAHSARTEAIIQTIPDHMYVLNNKGVYLKVYTSNYELPPAPPGLIIGKTIDDFFDKESAKKLYDAFNICIESGKLQICEVELLEKGRKNLYEVRMSKLDKDSILALARNITERKQAEKALRLSEEKYRLIYDNSPIGIFSFNDKGIIETCNDNLVKIIGSSREAIVGLDMLTSPDKNIAAAMQKVLAGNIGFYEGLYKAVSINNSIPLRVLFAPMVAEDGKFSGGVGILEDITERKQAEDEIRAKNQELRALNEELNEAFEDMQAANEELEKNNEELMMYQKELIEYGKALDESEKRFRDIYKNAVEGIFQTTPEGKLIGANPSYAATFGFDSPESIMKEVNNIGYQLYADPHDRERLLKLIAEQNRVVNFEGEARTCKGETIWVKINATGIRDESGSLKSITGSTVDITEAKLAEKVLRESEMRFDQLAEQNRCFIWEMDKNGLYTYVNHVVEQVLGYKPEELVGLKYFYDLCPEDEREQLKSEVIAVFEQRDRFTGLINPILAKDGRIVRVSTNAIPILDEQQALIGYRGSDTDVTDYMLAVDALRESELRYRNLIENTGQTIIVIQNGYIVYANPATFTVTGYSQEEIYSTPFKEFIYPDDRNMVIEYHHKRIAGEAGIMSVYKFRVISKDGNLKWFEINSVKIDWNKIPATLNFLTDFSEQMRMENELRESENKYRKIFENTQDVFYQTDFNGIINEISPSIKRYTGFVREELIGKPVESVYADPGDRAELLKIISEHGEVIDYELLLKGKDGRLIITSTSSHILFDSEGKPVGVEGSLRDISERKQIEEALREKENLHRLLTDNATDVIWTMDFSGRFIYVSPAVEKLRGYTVDEVMQQSFNELLMPESKSIAESYLASVNEAVKTGKPFPEIRSEFEQPCKDGTTVWAESTISAMYNNSGEIIGIVGVTRDISGRRLAEKSAADRLIFQQALIDSIPYSIFTKDANGRFVGCNRAYEREFGISRDYIIGKTVLDLEYLPMSERERFHSEDMCVINEVSQRSYEMPIVYADGNTHITLYSVNGFVLADGKPGGLIGMLVDITERKQAEEKIQNLLVEKELVLKEVHHRIKNNMNTINSLLIIQTDLVEDPAAVNALNDASARVQSMMVLYDKLYHSADFNEISVIEYLPSLIDEIVLNFPNSKTVKIEKSIDDIVLSTKILQPLGIIINELLTNIMKYAFIGRNDGLITVSASLKGNTFSLKIQDNGVGIPESVTFESSTGFGMQLVSMLINQINGTIRIERGGGTGFIVEFEI